MEYCHCGIATFTLLKDLNLPPRYNNATKSAVLNEHTVIKRTFSANAELLVTCGLFTIRVYQFWPVRRSVAEQEAAARFLCVNISRESSEISAGKHGGQRLLNSQRNESVGGQISADFSRETRLSQRASDSAEKPGERNKPVYCLSGCSGLRTSTSSFSLHTDVITCPINLRGRVQI